MIAAIGRKTRDSILAQASGTVPIYITGYGSNYMSTIQPDNTVDAGVFGSIDSSYQHYNGLESSELGSEEFESNSQGGLTFSVSPAGGGGDISEVNAGQNSYADGVAYVGYIGGFFIP